jgi:hypothetical protein
VFSLLNPFTLWLGAALAVPLAIHFLGRQRLKKQPFPSLLLVRERFSKSMQRHRLKNLLLLIIRTLLILCLLLALANPALQSLKSSAAKPDLSLALIHNGIYGRLPSGEDGRSGGNAGNTGNETLESQRMRLKALDSAEGIHTEAVPLIADGPGMQEVSERFGDYGEAVARLLAALGSRPGTAQIRIPVFSWTDAMPAREELARALKENPGLQIVLTEYGDAGARTSAFTGMKASPAADAPLVRLQAGINPLAPSGDAGKVRVTLNGRLFQEQAPMEGNVEVTLSVGEGSRTVGKLSMPQGGFASDEFHFCFPDAGQWVMAHAGSVLASLPSLGRETYFRRIIHVAGGKDIPWSGAPMVGTGSAPRNAAKAATASLKLVYLANERGVDPAAYSRAVEFVKQGGRLIIGVGRESDVPMLNRFLLQPLRLGRLGNLVEAPSSAPVSADRSALSRLGRLPADLGALGSVRKRFAFLPDSGTDILLSQVPPSASAEGSARENAGSARENGVLAARDFHRGKVLLWTTDIDDLNWSDLGVSPFTPLLHQALQETGSEERARNLSVASDSVMTMNLEEDESGAAAAGGPAMPAEVLDPEGRAFTKVRRDGRRLHIGPFDRLGIHRVVIGGDTTAFAVNLAGTVSSVGDAAKDEFLKAFAPYGSRLSVAPETDRSIAGTAVRALWPWLFLASILLLFLEGLIASAVSLRRSRT